MRVPPGYNPVARVLVLVFAAVLGAVVGLGQPPHGLWWLALAALSLLLALGRNTAPGRVGLAAGIGHAVLAMGWIVEPFQVEPDLHGWMAPFALALMALGMGLFWGLGMGLGARLGTGTKSRVAGMALGLFAADLARSYVFTGFPWGLFGHLWIDTPVAQGAAFVGALGLGAVTLGLAALPWLVEGRRRRAAAVLAGAVALGLMWAGGHLWLAQPLPPRAEPVTLRIVQPNAPQALKWRPEYSDAYFFRHLDLTALPPAPGQPRPDLILWPETAVPFLLEYPADGLELVAEAAGGVPVALGIQSQRGARYYNSLAVIGANATPMAVYDKVHLVPFGEYIPFGDALAHLGITAFAARHGNGYSAGAEIKLFDLGRLGLVQPLICYEAVFAAQISGRDPRPDWLMQVTNDAWFGAASGPQQHLALARFRAIEFGLPLARSANTGISALIDARGQVLASLPMDTDGVIDAALPPAAPVTPYARHGDYPFVEGLFAAALVLFAAARFGTVDRRRKQV